MTTFSGGTLVRRTNRHNPFNSTQLLYGGIMKIISRADAKAQNLKYFYTGEPCRHGHDSERYVGSNKACVGCVRLAKISYKNDNHDKIKEMKRKLYHADRDKHLEQRRASYQKHKIKRNAESAEYRKNNKDKLNEYYVNRRKTDLSFKISTYMRNMLNRVLNRAYNDKTNSTVQMLGYTCDELILHIESLFTDGMNWDNYGEWHIDHIVPLSVLVDNGLTDPSEVNALPNLQPLWAVDNLSKGNKV